MDGRGATAGNNAHFPMLTYAVDFESTYAKNRDLKTLGVLPYLCHPETHLYMVSIVGTDGQYFAGPVEQAPWAEISGKHWVSHNAGFDIAAFLAGQWKGQIPEDVGPSEWDCTANMAVLLGFPRSLAGAVEQAFGKILDKTTRDKMKGKAWADLTPEEKREVEEYALSDAHECLNLWTTYSRYVSSVELAVSRHTIEMCLRGVQIDLPAAMKAKETLTTALYEAQKGIPWANELDKKGKPVPILSPVRIKSACLALGIPPPASTASASEDFDRWAEQFSAQAPFVQAVKDYRSINRTLAVVDKILDQTFEDDSRLRYSLKYYGAHTGRFSGDAGLNFHNLTKRKIAGVDIRGLLVPKAGHKFFIADLKQIEAVVALWFAEDRKQLELIEQGMDVYEVHARMTMGYKDPRKLEDYVAAEDCPEADRNLRQFAKCRCVAEGTLILTQRGYVPIEQVLLTDRVWDGVEFVNHQGVINNGYKQTISIAGDQLTGDHLVFDGDQSARPAGEIHRRLAPCVAYREASCAPGYEVRQLAAALGRACADLWRNLCSLPLRVLRAGGHPDVEQPESGRLDSVPQVRQTQGGGHPGAEAMGEVH